MSKDDLLREREDNLKVLDPDLRRSLTRLSCTSDIDIGSAEDLDLINPKLIARKGGGGQRRFSIYRGVLADADAF
jgi:hypothetical protein